MIDLTTRLIVRLLDGGKARLRAGTFVLLLVFRENVVSFLSASAQLSFFRLRSLTVAVSDNIYIQLGVADRTYTFDGSSLLATNDAGCATLPVTDHPSAINIVTSSNVSFNELE